MIKKVKDYILYKIYSRPYKKLDPNLLSTIRSCIKDNKKIIYFLARKNGKERLSMIVQYVYSVETYDFKSAKIYLEYLKEN